MKYLLKGYDSIRCESTKIAPIRDFPTVSLKFASWNFAYKNTTDYVRQILDQMQLKNQHKYILVDIKVHDLKVGQIPALPHWHFDCVGDPRHPAKEEFHHLFITDGSSTEFLETSREVELPDEIHKNSFNHSQFNYLSGIKIKPYNIYSYQRHIHRATPAYMNGKRLLVRVSETDIIQPHNKTFKVTYR